MRREDILDLLCDYITGDLAWEVHAFALLRHGRLVAEGAFAPYKLADRHEIFSCTKALVGCAVGFAEAEGLLSLSDRVAELLADSLPEHPDERLKLLTVEHLMTMTAGFSAHGVHMTTAGHLPSVSTIRDKIAAVLGRPFDHTPGECFGYDNLCTYLLSCIITRLTGQTAEEYLAPRLFEPLGIAAPDLGRDEYGISHGYMGARLSIEEFAALGQLFLDGGVYRGRRILPLGYCERASRKQVDCESGVGPDWCEGYCYQFWRGRHGTYRFCGAYGQMCVVMPALDAVFAVFSGCNGEEIHRVLDAFYHRLLSVMEKNERPASSLEEESFADALSRLAVSEAYGTPSPLLSRFSHTVFTGERLGRVRLSFTGDMAQLTAESGLSFAIGLSHTAVTPLGGFCPSFDGSLVPRPTTVAADGVFLSPTLLAVTVHTLGTPFATRLLLDLEEGSLSETRFRF